jgi:hypothetical protein
MRLLILVLIAPIWLGASEAMGAEPSAFEECHAKLLESCDCDCINKGEATDCTSVSECLQNAGEKGLVKCTAIPSEISSRCSSPPCLGDCAVFFEIQTTRSGE